ncbi:hypothetical protein MRX96_024424 [Rhipicephalus microplus]
MSPGPSHTRAAGAPSLAVRSRVVAVLELGALLILLSWTFVFPVNGEPQGSFERLMEAVGKSPKRHGDLEDDIDDGRYARPRRSFERSYDHGRRWTLRASKENIRTFRRPGRRRRVPGACGQLPATGGPCPTPGVVVAHQAHQAS